MPKLSYRIILIDYFANFIFELVTNAIDVNSGQDSTKGICEESIWKICFTCAAIESNVFESERKQHHCNNRVANELENPNRAPNPSYSRLDGLSAPGYLFSIDLSLCAIVLLASASFLALFTLHVCVSAFGWAAELLMRA